ncbi:hypothetical protein LABALGNA3A7_06710 [Dellaglioa algida]|nr:hypothetical protein LABALGNA3A7_06710 [Dellaglioa algida]
MSGKSKFKLKAFISSAMGEETGTDWMDIRKSVENKLNECKYIEPFIIEKYAVETSSIQFFSWEVSKSDVIIFLIKGEVRPGTNQEIEMATEKGKPILVYFANSQIQDDSVMKFKEGIKNKDLTTFKNVVNFENIGDIILNDVINNIIYYYQFTHDISFEEADNEYFKDESLFEDNIFDKKYLNSFGSNKNALIENFSLEKYSISDDSETNENSISEKLFRWLCKGDIFVGEKDFTDFSKESALPNDTNKILKIRRQVTKQYYDGNLGSALEKLDKAYQLAKESGAPDWLLGDMLIDSRNIKGNNRSFYEKDQDKIKTMNTYIHFPVGDRFVKEAFEILEKERVEIRTLSVSTIRFGNTLLNSLKCIENYLYVSFLVGSATHLVVARKKMIDILIEYGEIYKDENLIYQSLKLIILAGEAKLFSKITKRYWSKINDVLAVNIKELWELTDVKYCINREIMKCMIIKLLGQYMDDTLFMKGMVFIEEYSNEYVSPDKSVYVLNSINNNLKRFNKNIVLDVLLNILNANKVVTYNGITKILSNIDITNCENGKIIELSTVLEEKIDVIFKNNETSYFIINLLKQNTTNFNNLYGLIKDKMSEDQIDYIEFKLGDEYKAKKILTDSVTKAAERFSKEIKSGVHYEYANEPLAVIGSVIQESNIKNFVELVNQKLFPLVVDILSSETSLNTKGPCLELLVKILIKYKKEHQKIPVNLKEFFSETPIKLYEEFMIGGSSLVSLKYSLNIISVILGIEDEDSIFSTCITYKERDENERASFSYLIQNYIEYNSISKIKNPKFVELVILEMLRDEYFVVRKNALKCLIYIYKSDPSEIFKGELVRMTMDNSPNLKGFYIELLKGDYLIDTDKEELLLLFSKDASYNVREAIKN